MPPLIAFAGALGGLAMSPLGVSDRPQGQSGTGRGEAGAACRGQSVRARFRRCGGIPTPVPTDRDERPFNPPGGFSKVLASKYRLKALAPKYLRRPQGGAPPSRPASKLGGRWHSGGWGAAGGTERHCAVSRAMRSSSRKVPCLVGRCWRKAAPTWTKSCCCWFDSEAVIARQILITLKDWPCFRHSGYDRVNEIIRMAAGCDRAPAERFALIPCSAADTVPRACSPPAIPN